MRGSFSWAEVPTWPDASPALSTFLGGGSPPRSTSPFPFPLSSTTLRESPAAVDRITHDERFRKRKVGALYMTQNINRIGARHTCFVRSGPIDRASVAEDHVRNATLVYHTLLQGRKHHIHVSTHRATRKQDG
eukprot:4807979-Pyramimonas_sp.AAC.2